MRFTHRDGDHELGNLNMYLDVRQLSPTRFELGATFGLPVWTGNWDDEYSGTVYFTVIGE
ncbi:hypothetical protein JOF56_003823 [Kibdelosporangium banguiense]|uniref:Uncharacterized protein n=1 Tax=Kibdelosporangium banguiense TaxID=1365924 RepID=A0ABS4THV0_9PSEU|nr:hypothetical protein [Kibdelosporangium banguiense]